MRTGADVIHHGAECHLGKLFFQRVEELGNRTFLKLFRSRRVKEISWRHFGGCVERMLRGLIALGRVPGDAVAIIGENCPEWMSADLATLCGGLPNVVFSPALSDRTLRKVLAHAECRLAFVQDEVMARRIWKLRGGLPALQHVIVMTLGRRSPADTLSLDQLMTLSRRTARSQAHDLAGSVRPDDLATIIYTSGSTGEPKGVMRTHRNLFSNISNGGEIATAAPDEVLVIVLSLNHLFGRFGFLKSVATGRTTALVESAEGEFPVQALEKLSGTAMAVVPRVMQRIWSALVGRGLNRRLWEELERFDQARTENGALAEPEARRFERLRTDLASAVRRALGGRLRYISYGGAAMSPRILRCFELLGIPLIGSYGLTECGGVTLSRAGENRPGNLGKVFPNVEIRIAEDGEILIRGPTVTPGYYKDESATRAAFDSDGWFRSGDLGALDADGSLRIVGRKKDVFNCSDGSNVYPGHIEMLLESDPLIEQAVLLGDGRPFIAALLVPDRDRIAESLGLSPKRLRGREIASAVRARIERINRLLDPNARIRKFTLLKEGFPTEVRSVTVYQKIKIDRSRAETLYAREIAELYGEAHVEARHSEERVAANRSFR